MFVKLKKKPHVETRGDTNDCLLVVVTGGFEPPSKPFDNFACQLRSVTLHGAKVFQVDVKKFSIVESDLRIKELSGKLKGQCLKVVIELTRERNRKRKRKRKKGFTPGRKEFLSCAFAPCPKGRLGAFA